MEDAKALLEIVPMSGEFLKLFIMENFKHYRIEKHNELPFSDLSAPTTVSILLFWSNLSTVPLNFFFFLHYPEENLREVVALVSGGGILSNRYF